MKYFLSLFTIIYTFSTLAQPTQKPVRPSIGVVAKTFGDSIMLRFAPTTPVAWQKGNRSGYTIERYVLFRDGKRLKNPERTTLVSTKPLPFPAWETLAKQNKYAAIAAQAIYGKTFSVANNSAGMMAMVSVAKETENRFSFALFAADQSFQTAAAAGLAYTDRQVKKGEQYLYRIFLHESQEYAIDTGFVFIEVSNVKKLPKVSGLKAVFGDKSVVLSWNNVYYKDVYSSYTIERSSDNGQTFIQTNELPFVQTTRQEIEKSEYMHRLDSLPDNDKKYVLRIKGNTLFGETGPASDTVQGVGLTKADFIAPTILKATQGSTGAMKIQWRMPEKYRKQVEKFEVLRAEKIKGNFQVLAVLSSDKNEYTDMNPLRHGYYIVKAETGHGTFVLSHPYLAQMADSIPPNAPQRLKALIDTSGKLTLSWQHGHEEDLNGYKVYLANSATEEFTQVSKTVVRDTIFNFEVSLKTLTKSVYLKVLALDYNFNPSGFSQVLEVKRPDRMLPVSPVFDNYKASDTGIYLHWILSGSNDVVRHTLYRREKGASTWEVLAVFENDRLRTSFEDTTVRKLKVYEYALTAKDNGLLETPKENTLTASLIDYGFRPDIGKVSAKPDRLQKQIALSWQYTSVPDKFYIYRAVKGSPLRHYRTIAGTEQGFTDRDLTINTEYSYRIKAIFLDGGQSKLTEVVFIQY